MTMKSWIARSAVVLAVAFVASIVALHAEDSGVFKNTERVRQAQAILAANGYLEHDSYHSGEMDQCTRRALSEYQREHSLNNNGILDDETFQSLATHGTEYPWDSAHATAVYEHEEEEPAPDSDLDESPTRSRAVVNEASYADDDHDRDLDADADRDHADDYDADKDHADHEEHAKMPATGSDLPLLLLTGIGLIGGGALLLRQRAV